MAEPTKKAEEIEQLLKTINPKHRDRRESIRNNVCNWCGQPATTFKDELSKKEYTISGLCQKCQDQTFNPCPRMRGREYV